jgi:Protein of unknown function (DUF2934)
MDEAMHKAIQVRAYFLWLQAGCPDGQDVLHWLQAEAEAELGLNPEVDGSELGRSSASEAAASQDAKDISPERPPAAEPYG